MLNYGLMNKLKVIGKNAQGYQLIEEKSQKELLIEHEKLENELAIGKTKEFFVYLDTNDMIPQVSERKPVAVVGEFAFLRVVAIHEFGAFAQWGLEKDLLIPGNMQKEKIGSYGRKLVRICLEEETNRVYGTTKIGSYIEGSACDLKEGSKVEFQVVEKTQLGYRGIVNKKYIGMIYHNEIFQSIEVGEYYSFYLKKKRSDGLLDISTKLIGVKNIFDSSKTVLNYLKQNGGESHLSDKSSPEEIKRVLNMSKKSFKSAIGILFKEKKILISKTGIKLLQ